MRERKGDQFRLLEKAGSKRGRLKKGSLLGGGRNEGGGSNDGGTVRCADY